MPAEILQTQPRKTSFFSLFPWTLLIIGYMVVMQVLGIPMDGLFGYIFVSLCIAILFIEFFKSIDNRNIVFLIDQVNSTISLIVASSLMCVLIFTSEQGPTYFHWIGCAVIVGDAIISPFNAYKAAKRNIQREY